MSYCIYLLLGDNPETPLTWARVDEKGTLQTHGDAPSFVGFMETVIPDADEKLYALLPGEVTALRLMPLPPKGRGQFQSAAQYLLEDTLAENIDQLHVATALRGAGEASSGLCLAVSTDIMDAWHATFHEAGIFPDMMTADYLGLPLRPPSKKQREDAEISTSAENLMCIFTHQEGLLANGTAGGFSMDKHTAISVLPDIIAQWDPDHIDLYAQKNFLTVKNPHQLSVTENAGMAELIGLFHEVLGSARHQSVPNLLSGPYGRKINWNARLAPWQGIGIAAGLCAAAFFGSWVFDGVRAGQTADHYNQVAQEVHDNAFPEESGANPVAHARQVLSQGTESMSFLTLWTGFAQAVQNMDGVQVDTIYYAGSGSDMRININVDTLDSLDSFKEALLKHGIRAQEGRMNQTRSGQYSGELTVKL